MTEQAARKMFDIDVVETSIVDHPAHTVEGWVVMKSADQKQIEGLFGPQSTAKGTVMGDVVTPTAPTVEDLTKALADRDAKIEVLTKAAAAAEDPKEAMLKALPDEVRAMLKASDDRATALEKAAAADRERFEKAENARLDEKAVADLRTMLKSVAIDADALAPAIRLLPAEAQEVIKTALRAADEQVATAGLFKAAGSDAAPAGGEGLSKIDAAVTELMKSNPELSRPAAMAKAVENDPTLYTDYYTELGK